MPLLEKSDNTKRVYTKSQHAAEGKANIMSVICNGF